jgi:sugar transferase (PEP-CTERM/EpsH1 system associated)
MKILWVKAGGLVPPDTGGKIRSYHILKELAGKHKITLYTYYGIHPNDVHHSLEGLFERTICRPIKIPVSRSISDFADYAKHLFSPYPHVMSRYYRREILKEVRQLVQTENFDVIVCDFLIPGRVIPWDLSCPKVLFTHNVEATIYLRQYEMARNALWKIAARREYRRTERIEYSYLKKSDHVLTVSDTDREAFARLIDFSKITTIPTGVDAEYFQSQDGGSQPNTVVFTGSMDYLPNEDAMVYFVNCVLPLIRYKVPNVSVLIVGRRPSAKVLALAESDHSIHVTGRVEDVRPYMRQGAVYIVPIRIGSGTRLKIFEAMAMGKPIVATAIGAEGLPVEDGVNILIANSAEEFAQHVTGLLQYPANGSKLGRAARQLVEKEYSWAAVAAHFESVLKRLTAGSEGRANPK